MKKIYTIGREADCDIIINDETDVISRLHATLRIDSKGKIYITDQSRNGTYINGMKMSSNVEIPICRKDKVSFANIKELDWSLIPDVNKKKNIILFSSLGFICILFLLFTLLLDRNEENNAVDNTIEPSEEIVIPETKCDTVVVRDTVKIKEKTPVVEYRKSRDTIKKEPEIKKEEVFNPIY